MSDNCINTTKKLLTLIGVKYTKKYLTDNILSHPDYPSLLSITDTLQKYHIETLAVKIDIQKLKEMPMPCIVQLNEKQPMFFVLNCVSSEEVSYYNNESKLVKQTIEEFSKQWTGVCLLVEKTELSKEKNIEKKIATLRFQKALKVIIGIMLLSWIGFSFINSSIFNNFTPSVYAIAYSVLKAIGLTVGVFLLWFEVDQYNPTLQSFCTGGIGSKINCNAVLNSKYAKLFNGTISLSLLVFSYFFATLTFLIINNFSLSSLSVLGWLSFICLPIIIASIYYQAFVIKQWCKFCIAIQGVLVLEIGISFFSRFYKNPIIFESLPLLLALFLLPILGWPLLKSLIKQEKELNIYKRGLKKIKQNPSVLEALLTKSRKIETPKEGLGISFYNSTAKYNVIKVCNPYCGPCAKAHPILEELVNTGKINLQILFTASADEKDTRAKPVRHFLAIDEENKSKTKQALDDWYLADKKDYEVFVKKYPVNNKLKQQNKKIEAMRSWCDTENITHTPTIFINGYELPKEYRVEDLLDVLQ